MIFPLQDFAKANAEELGVQPVPSLNLVCSGDDESFEYITADEAKEKGLEVSKAGCLACLHVHAMRMWQS